MLPTFSDESSTGRHSEHFRGLRRATIAARVDDSNGFEWFRRFRSDFLPDHTEPKSELILQVAGANTDAQSLLMDNIGRATIVIVDFAEHYRQLLTPIIERNGGAPLTHEQAVAMATKIEAMPRIGHHFLAAARDLAVYRTMIPQVERLLREAMHAVGLHDGDGMTLFDETELRELNHQEFQQLAVRFGVAFADALAPDRQAAAISRAIDDVRYLHSGRLAIVTLGSTIEPDRFFDEGFTHSMALLRRAHNSVVDRLFDEQMFDFMGSLRPGRIVEEDSRLLTGIQVADIAARVASNIYERHSQDRYAGARAVKQVFDRVLLNEMWL
jgi:hypothetical protein